MSEDDDLNDFPEIEDLLNSLENEDEDREYTDGTNTDNINYSDENITSNDSEELLEPEDQKNIKQASFEDDTDLVNNITETPQEDLEISVEPVRPAVVGESIRLEVDIKQHTIPLEALKHFSSIKVPHCATIDSILSLTHNGKVVLTGRVHKIGDKIGIKVVNIGNSK